MNDSLLEVNVSIILNNYLFRNSYYWILNIGGWGIDIPCKELLQFFETLIVGSHVFIVEISAYPTNKHIELTFFSQISRMIALIILTNIRKFTVLAILSLYINRLEFPMRYLDDYRQGIPINLFFVICQTLYICIFYYFILA